MADTPLFTDDLKVYLNRPAPCPYLPGRLEQRLLVPLDDKPATAAMQLGFFTQLGFRRSQNFMYRPHCGACTACISYRLPVARFMPNASQARTQRRNHDLDWQEISCEEAQGTLYTLFAAYQRQRHAESEMAQFTDSDFAVLLAPGARHGMLGTTVFMLTLAGTPVGAVLADRTEAGFSAVYSFYDAALAQRSLGTELVMRLVGQAQREDRPYLYLGYWIEQSPKMAYKNRFRPAETLTELGWVHCPDCHH